MTDERDKDQNRKVMNHMLSQAIVAHVGPLVKFVETMLGGGRVDFLLILRKQSDGESMHSASVYDEEQLEMLERTIDAVKRGGMFYATTKNGKLTSEPKKRTRH